MDANTADESEIQSPVVEIIFFHLQALFTQANQTYSAESVASLKRLIARLLIQTKTSPPIVYLALFYLSKLRESIPYPNKIAPSFLAQYQILTVALIISTKVHDDNRFSNDAWSKIVGIKLSQLNALELQFLECLEWKMFVHPDLYWHMTRHVGMQEQF
ncbi:hypothetical protein BJ741DRAFT_608646 [Chytriomyces cf. hyalinus JEL632]|nr:hypothetical protein BJ741DRAFT_608646 [Chytriomyces cf. hyalinus JEL632]